MYSHGSQYEFPAGSFELTFEHRGQTHTVSGETKRGVLDYGFDYSNVEVSDLLDSARIYKEWEQATLTLDIKPPFTVVSTDNEPEVNVVEVERRASVETGWEHPPFEVINDARKTVGAPKDAQVVMVEGDSNIEFVWMEEVEWQN